MNLTNCILPKIGQFTILVIIFAIKSCFFPDTDSYSLKHKSYTFYFFSLFYIKIIRVVYAIFAIIIKNLEVYLGIYICLGKT